jgi:hypothetical protein
MIPSPLDRRELLMLFAALGALSVPVRGRATETSLCQSWMATDVEAIRALGREYLAMHSGDSDLSAIRSLFDQPASAEAEIVARLRRLVRADYQESRTVRLDGWFVSLTEARIFAALSGDCSRS